MFGLVWFCVAVFGFAWFLCGFCIVSDRFLFGGCLVIVWFCVVWLGVCLVFDLFLIGFVWFVCGFCLAIAWFGFLICF